MCFISQHFVGACQRKVVNLSNQVHLLSIKGCGVDGAVTVQFGRLKSGIDVHLPQSARCRMSLWCSFDREHMVLVDFFENVSSCCLACALLISRHVSFQELASEQKHLWCHLHTLQDQDVLLLQRTAIAWNA